MDKELAEIRRRAGLVEDDVGYDQEVRDRLAVQLANIVDRFIRTHLGPAQKAQFLDDVFMRVKKANGFA